jgi:hypothetical protein
VNDADIAVEVSVSVTGLREAAEPTPVPLEQVAFDPMGPQTVKFTEPLGAPPAELPVTVAASVMDPPRLMEPEVDCWVAIEDPAALTVKHSLSLWGPASA